MIYRLGHFYGYNINIPGAIERKAANSLSYYEIEIDNIIEFVEKYGPVILSPPGKPPFTEGWFIWITDSSGRFVQK